MTKAIVAGALGALLTACAPVDLLVRDVTVYSREDAPPFKATVAVKDGTFAAVERAEATDFLLLKADPGIDVANVRQLRDVYIAGKKRL